MSRIRTVKPEFFRSASLARCCIPARLTFQGLWTEADDLGRGVADAKVLAGLLWPHDDDIGADVVEIHLRELAATGHIDLYVVDGKRHFVVRNFNKHQSASLRRGEGKYPAPEEGSPWSEAPVVILHDQECKDVQKSAGSGSGSGGERERDARRPAARKPPFPLDAFNEFWDAYPRKLSKDAGRVAYGKALTAGATPGSILDSLAAWQRQWTAEQRDLSAIPYPASWLNRGDWRETPEATPLASRRANRMAAIERGMARAAR